MTHDHCPRFQTCNASICPLDPAWREAVHLPGEKACFYLLNLVKAGADERFEDDPVAIGVRQQAAAVQEAHPDIARRVGKAAKSGFRRCNLPLRTRDTVRQTTSESA